MTTPVGVPIPLAIKTSARESLERETVGFREILFQSITAMSPAGALAVSVVIGANYAGGALVLAMVFAFLPCLTVAVSIAQLTRYLPAAGGLYVYPATALHPAIGDPVDQVL